MFSFAVATDVWLRQVDRRRNTVLALLLVKIGVESLFGIAPNVAVTGILAGWLALGLVIGRFMARVDDARLRVRLRTCLVIASAAAVSLAQYLFGGAVLLGGAAYFYLLAITAIALPARTLAVVTGVCTVAYGVPLLGEALGWWGVPSMGGVSQTAPTLMQAGTAWMFTALALVSVASILHSFVRLVRRAAEWHQLLVEQAPVMIGTIDRTGQITAANPAADAGFGVPAGALVGRTARDLFLAPEPPEPNAAASRLDDALGGRPQQFEARVRRADGVERWVDVVMHPLGAGRGHVGDLLCLLRDVTDARAVATALERQAYHDPLTGLANRARLAARLGEVLARATRDGEPERIAVLVLDLDGFKTVNDSLGHAAGDALLVEVAARLLDATRGSDTVARLGGDEFAVVIDRVRSDADVVRVADRILEALRAAFTIEGHVAHVGTSIGIVRAGARALGDAEVDTASAGVALLRNADAAMYRAKAQGKGQWTRFESDLHATAVA